MTRYLALLRGINVGTAKRVPMADLRAMATDLGFADVSTHLNSGNLLLSGADDPATVRSRVEQGIEDRFGLHADVVVRTAAQLRAAVALNPFPDGDPSRVVVAFLAGPPGAGAEAGLAALATEDEPFLLTATEAYVHFGHGQADSRLALKLATVLGVSATARNLRTVTTLLQLSRP